MAASTSGSLSSGSSSSAQNPVQQNLAIRKLIIQSPSVVDMRQPVKVYNINNFTPGQYYPINIPLNNVGLNKRLYIECVATMVQGASETQTKTKLGLANIFSQVQLTDLSNFNRITVPSWYLHLLASARRMRPYGAAITNSDPCDLGNNVNVISAPSSFTTSSTGYHIFDVPLSYSDKDLRGAIYANITGATWYLQLTINPQFFVTSTGDPTFACYQSSTTQLGVLTNLKITIYQQYLDQLPQNNGQVLLPAMDLGTAYLLNQSTNMNFSANNLLTLPFANYRNFMSTMFAYDNGATVNPGTDITNFQLQNANLTNIFQDDPQMNSLMTRELCSTDWPTGFYYFDFRKKPIMTNQYGNYQLCMTPNSVQSGATLQVLYESLGLIGQVMNAGSITSQ